MPLNPKKIGVVILGAGFSKRFGSDKRLHELGNFSVAETTAQIYCDSFKNTRIVVRPEDNELTNLLQSFDVELLSSKNAESGMGHSLADGMINLDWDWAFIALLDMPFIKRQTLNALIQSAEESDPLIHKIIRGHLNSNPDRATHPVGFHRSLFSELSKCSGDVGAKTIIEKYAAEIRLVDSEDAGLFLDIDQPADLATTIQTRTSPN